ncbi:MAG TPA: DUF4389 domain-containing protein [Thermoleophilaceae bacterium]|nr:DUF4389 domain-containing protein [Thermoleophilaceae bacterium]
MKIEIKAGPNAGQQHDIEEATVIGRDPTSATLVIDDPEASRRHAALRPGGDGVVVEDLGSTNGTFVNGDRVDGARNAGAGDEVRIGNTVLEVQGTIEVTRMSPVPESSDPGATAIGSPAPPPAPPAPPEPAGGPPAAPQVPAPEPVAASEPFAAPQPPATPPAPPLATSEPPAPPPPPGGGAPPPPPPGGGQGAGAPPQQAPPQSPPPQYSPPGSPPGSYPPVAYGGGGSSYPVDFDTQYPTEGIDRWRPIFHGWLLIPHWFALFFVGIGVLFTWIITWWAILITGKYPEGLFNFHAGFYRWTNRFTAYSYWMVDKYPPFSLGEEPGYPVQTRIEYPPEGKIARWRVFVQGLMAIPHFVVVYFLIIAMFFVLFVAWFAVVFTRRWPEGLFKFTVGVIRWNTRAGAYGSFWMREEYPPFQLDP